jgi:uncharacterized membrane protein YdjX (TVP38/TMEM64 family)
MEEKSSHSPSKKSKLPLYLSLLLVGGVVLCYFTIPSVNHFFKDAWSVLTSDDEGRIKSWVEGFGWFGPVSLVLAMVIQMFLLVIPTTLIMVVAVLAYGPFWGSVISFAAVLTAATVGYFIGKYVGSQFVGRLLGEKTEEKVTSFVGDYGFWAVAVTRVNPFLSNDAISFVAGMVRMNYWKFILATLLGIAPLVLLLALTGSNTDSLKGGLLWGSLASLLIFGCYIWWDKKKNQKA